MNYFKSFSQSSDARQAVARVAQDEGHSAAIEFFLDKAAYGVTDSFSLQDKIRSFESGVATAAFKMLISECRLPGDPCRGLSSEIWIRFANSNEDSIRAFYSSLWRALPESWREDQLPYLSSHDGSLDDLAGLVERFDHEPHVMQAVWFPTAEIDEGNPTETVFLFRVVVSFRENTSVAGQDKRDEVLPRIIQRPRSRYCVEAMTLATVEKGLATMLQNSDLKLPDGSLIEIDLQHRPLQNEGEASPAPKTNQITGRSLTLAVCIATWASLVQRELQPILASASMVGPRLRGVEYILQKSKALNDTYFKYFLVEEANYSEVVGPAWKERCIPVKGIPDQRFWNNYGSTILTDGFDLWRTLLLDSTTSSHGDDSTGLATSNPSEPISAIIKSALETIADACDSETTDDDDKSVNWPADEHTTMIAVPFGDDPSKIACKLTIQLTRLLQQFPAEQGLPRTAVPLYLGSVPSSDAASKLTSCIVEGANTVRQFLNHSLDAQPPFTEFVLQNRLRQQTWLDTIFVCFEPDVFKAEPGSQSAIWLQMIRDLNAAHLVLISNSIHSAACLK
ncbi:hypothetical protein [Stratiformator vulcanicus]|uniref:Uncharacterized protein n=1 Tax=Stratiformator vulcanicus TaxID=2527980 RepID=A0A517QWR5_9PLAN|nr:hypothetical protein [Stratiformator vulcanicus]QDT36008.1 hypothetical protein Pan189_03630 [Stratiformator vulcanicus]